MILSTGMSLSTEHEAAAAPCGASHLEEMLPAMAFFFFFLLFFVCDLLLCRRYSVTEAVPTLVLV